MRDLDESDRTKSARKVPIYGGTFKTYEQWPRPKSIGRDMGTLLYLIDDPTIRKTMMGAGDFWFNEMTEDPCHGTGPVMNDDVTDLRGAISEFTGSVPNGKAITFSTEDVQSAISLLSRRNPRHMVREYLLALKWDGVSRLPGIFSMLHLDDATRGLQQEYVRRWLVSAVARVIDPGCQVDSVLILRGPEGRQKSRLFERLGHPWFGRVSSALGARDAVEQMKRSWILELDELEPVLRSTTDSSTIKAFITRNIDDYVPKWERSSIKVKRSSVFCGTTNELAFLSEGTGFRRWWVVDVPEDMLEIGWFNDNRDQLWAEAVSRYHGSTGCLPCKTLGAPDRCEEHRWWLSRSLENVQREDVERHRLEDPWLEQIRSFVESKPAMEVFMTSDLLLDALKLPAHAQHAGSSRRLATIMQAMGYVHHRTASTKGWRKK